MKLNQPMKAVLIWVMGIALAVCVSLTGIGMEMIQETRNTHNLIGIYVAILVMFGVACIRRLFFTSIFMVGLLSGLAFVAVYGIPEHDRADYATFGLWTVHLLFYGLGLGWVSVTRDESPPWP